MEMIFMIAICYVSMVAIGVAGIAFTAKKRVIPQEEPMPMEPIIGESKSVMLKPPITKPNPAQVPDSEVENLFKDNKPIRADFECEYDDEEKIELSDEEEEMGIEENDDVAGEQTHRQCIDYMDMEAIVERMVHGTLQREDIPLLQQLEGSDIYEQIKGVMSKANLELMQTMLNKI